MGAPIAFMEQMEARTLKSNKQTAITIRTNNGEAEQISIPNSNNWLFRLIKKELASYFPEVQTAEEARQDIQRRKPSAGREKKNAIYSAVAYGIYRMLHEENAIPSQPNMPNELCQLIHDYTRVTGCYPNNKGESGKYDPKVIRADLAAYLKRAAMNQAPRFRPIPLQRQVIMQDFDFPLLDWSDYITIPLREPFIAVPFLFSAKNLPVSWHLPFCHNGQIYNIFPDIFCNIFDSKGNE